MAPTRSWLGLLGKFTTGLWCGFVAAVILGFDVELQRELWRRDVERLSTLRRDDEM